MTSDHLALGVEQLALELPPPDPRRDAIALALVMAEDDDDATEVADAILAAYELDSASLRLMTHLAVLVSLEREDADEWLYGLALEAIHERKQT